MPEPRGRMFRRLMFRRLMLLSLLSIAPPALAAAEDTRWVSDQLRISMRSGPGDGFEIVQILATGTALQTAERRGDWVRVRLEDGAAGWVVARYLESEKPAGLELPSVRSALATAEGRVEELQSVVSRLKNDLAELQELRARTRELEVANLRLESAAGATMMTLGAGIALVGVLLGAFWPRRSGSRGIAIPRSYFRS